MVESTDEELKYCLVHRSMHDADAALGSCQLISKSEWPSVFGKADNPKTYRLILSSYNITTTIPIELTSGELELMNDIERSLRKQNAQTILSVRETGHEHS